MHGMEDVGVCVLVEGGPLETPPPERWSTCLTAFFFAREKKRENGGERVGRWWGSRRDYSLLESGFWGRKAQESVNLASLGGGFGWAGGPGRAD